MSSISSIAHNVQSKKVTAKSLVEAALSRADEANQYNVLLSTVSKRALERADEIDNRIRNGENVGRLAGVPFIAKDNFLTYGSPTTAASKMLEHFDAPFQATAVEKLEAEGAICIGKANLDSFAHGSSTENSAFGPTLNAHDKTRVAGGSSGGSAVAVALGIVPFALGSDTGGSIREPASFNGIVGVKPTYGMLSRYGVVAMASSTDVVGPLAKTVEDTELLLDILAGKDEHDATTLSDYFQPNKQPVSVGKIGVIKEFMSDDVDSEVRDAVLLAIEKYKSHGYGIEEVSLPLAPQSLAMYYIIVPAEVSSNLARYDGIKYGHQSSGADSLKKLYSMSRSEGFMDENIRRIMIGSYVLSSGYFDAYYQQAQKARTLLIEQFENLFNTYDALIGPVTPSVAFKIGENIGDPIKMYLADIMTVSSSLAGLPSISVPVGEDEQHMPIGLQIICPFKKDANMLSIAKIAEQGVKNG